MIRVLAILLAGVSSAHSQAYYIPNDQPSLPGMRHTIPDCVFADAEARVLLQLKYASHVVDPKFLKEVQERYDMYEKSCQSRIIYR